MRPGTALMLDRLVRQGRAFGIHVLLGSQTLGGAYTLARTNAGQMAVRIALQCSEADAHLILSEDNTAARLLNRPGEAIYNDANGLYEGNHPFQIVWLSDVERDHYLEQIDRLQKQLGEARPRRSFSRETLRPSWRTTQACANCWTRRPGRNPIHHAGVARVGRRHQRPDRRAVSAAKRQQFAVGRTPREASLGVLSACFLSVASRYATGAAKFYVLDGMRTDAPEVGTWQRVAAAVPHDVKIVGIKDTPSVAEIAAEIAARHQSVAENAPPIFVFLYNLGRFRNLRKEDDFGFSSDSGGASPAKQFVTILREGPEGVHTLVWCDTYTNVTRQLDRRNLQDFEMRVLFQMNATDSSSLMDAPDAGRLGVHLAICRRRPRHLGKVSALRHSVRKVSGVDQRAFERKAGRLIATRHAGRQTRLLPRLTFVRRLPTAFPRAIGR